MRKFILGTDWWTDCDDAIAIRLIVRAHKRGDIELCAVGINAAMEYSVASLDAFLALEGCFDIPLGIDLAATDFTGNPPYQKRLAPRSVRYKSNEEAEDAVSLYRRILSNASEPVEIIEIGFLQVFANLLESGADAISEKSGVELVREKVSHVWVMAGKWDKDGECEHNFANNQRARDAAKLFCDRCPVPVTFLGWEVGYGVITGGKLEHEDHLYTLLCDHRSQNGRHSWDPMLTLLALIDNEERAGYDTVSGSASVDPETGANYFKKHPCGTHKFVVKKQENAFYAAQINKLL